jgi:multiple sugar transport system substrate-binding protein
MVHEKTVRLYEEAGQTRKWGDRLEHHSYFLAAIAVVVAVIGASIQITQEVPVSHAFASPQSKENITMTVQFAGPNETSPLTVFPLVDSAADKLRSNHPDLDIHVKYSATDYNNYRNQLLKALNNGTSVDVVTLDQIWLGEFAEKKLLTDLTNYTQKWGRSSDWYQSNLDGGVHEGKVYGIWFETDVRGIWYWKDMLDEAGVDPNSLKTWDGYIDAAKKLNTALRPHGIEGVHLTGASHSPDLWYPYLWMLGGDIVQLREGHPTKDAYWSPTYNNTEGIKALQFIKNQVDAGISPQKNHSWGKEFANRKFAVMLEGSWLPSYFPPEQWSSIKQRVGFIPLFPVPGLDSNKTSTLMGGGEFSIPSTSSNKNLAWELIEIMLQPQILSPWIAKQGYLPTQTIIGEGPYADPLRKSIPFYDEMISMIPEGRGRPSIPEYPAIAEDIRQALDEVYYGVKEPKQALNDAAAKSAKTLGW